MLEKIKGYILYIVTPLALLAGYIWYLLSKNQELKDQVTQGKSEAKQKELSNEQEKTDTEANDAVANYQRLRDEYLKNHKGE